MDNKYKRIREKALTACDIEATVDHLLTKPTDERVMEMIKTLRDGWDEDHGGVTVQKKSQIELDAADLLETLLSENRALHDRFKEAHADHTALQRAIVGDTGASAILEADRLLSENKALRAFKEAIDECKEDTWQCEVCGHAEPWWKDSNADYLTRTASEQERD